jgi:hypothetical protein
MFSTRDLKTSTIREYGATYFLESIAERIGLQDALSAACGHLSGEILTLAKVDCEPRTFGSMVCGRSSFCCKPMLYLVISSLKSSQFYDNQANVIGTHKNQ